MTIKEFAKIAANRYDIREDPTHFKKGPLGTRIPISAKAKAKGKAETKSRLLKALGALGLTAAVLGTGAILRG